MTEQELKEHFRVRKPVQCIEGTKYLLDRFKLLEPKIYMEIGCAHLATLEVFADDLPREEEGGLAIGIDLNNGFKRAHVPFSWDEYEPRSKCGKFLIRGASGANSTVEQVRVRLNGRKIDFLFIDGGHDYDIVKADYELYSPYVRDRGIIAFHDTMESSGPNKLTEQLKKQGIAVEDVKSSMATRMLVVNKQNN